MSAISPLPTLCETVAESARDRAGLSFVNFILSIYLAVDIVLMEM